MFNNGATGMRHTSQQYYTLFAQDEWHATSKLTLNYGLRYEYYTPLKDRDNLIVKFNIETGQIDPNTTPLHGSKKDNVQPRLSATYALDAETVLRGGFGIFVGPGQGEDLIQPIESDRVSTTLSTGPLLAYPINQELLVANFTSNPNNRNYQPRAYAQEYAIPEKVLPVHGVGAAGAGRRLRHHGRLRRQPGTQPVPAQRRQPDHRRSSPTRTRRARRSSSASSRSSRATPTATSPACRTRTPRSTSRPAAARTATTR